MPRVPWRRSTAVDDDGAARERLRRAFGVADAPAAAVDGGSGAVARSAPEPAYGAGVTIDPGRRGVAALALVAILSVALTVGVIWRGRARPVVVAAPTVTATGVVGPAGEVVVDVAGAVRRPGLVRLPLGARVADAIAAAGGVRPGATTAGLNLARRVADGEQVVVLPPGTAAPPGAAPRSSTSSGSVSGRLDLNSATAEQLDALPGVGPVTAQRIIAWRTEHGRFASVNQLREIAGIGEKRFAALRELVAV